VRSRHFQSAMTSIEPEITAIICTYNRAESLRQVLESCAVQTAEPDVWELLVVDNASADNTSRVVADFARSAPIRVRHVFEAKQGKSFALNTGIVSSRGSVLAFTDDDVIIDRNWISAIREAVAKYPYKAFGGKVVPLWPKSIPKWIQPSGPYARPIVGGPIVSHNIGDEPVEYGARAWGPAGANMFFRRELFTLCGVFDTRLGPRGTIYGSYEDSELTFRLRARGEKLFYVPSAVVFHPVPNERLAKKYLLHYFWQAGRTFGRMNCPNPRWRRARALIKPIFSLLGRAVGCLSGLVTGNAPRLMHHRCLLYHDAGRLCSYSWGENQPIREEVGEIQKGQGSSAYHDCGC
jgi:glucosyl-dolichyl phosphate glucuronosyltransferase